MHSEGSISFVTTSGRSTPTSSVRIVWWGADLWSLLKRIKSTGIRVMHLQRVDCRLRKWEKKNIATSDSCCKQNDKKPLDREQSLSSLFTSFSVYLESCRSDISAFFSVNFSSDCPCCQTLDELFFLLRSPQPFLQYGSSPKAMHWPRLVVTVWDNTLPSQSLMQWLWRKMF